MTSAQDCDIHTLSITQLREAYARQQFTPQDVLQSLFKAIGDDPIHAFTALDKDTALEAAQASSRRWQLQTPRSVLDGIPVSIKDLIAMKGLPARRGSLTTSTQPVPDDAPVVQLLRDSGAVLFGKTTTTEWGSAIHGDSPAHGRTLNPMAHDRTVGGSSCGAAAQLASHWGPMAIGSDAGGSVRVPASYTGLVAFKPTFGCIPAWPISPFAEFAHLGPMGRCVEDIALAMQVIGQPHSKDPASLYPRQNNAGLRGRTQALRIGYCTQMGEQAAGHLHASQAMHELVHQRWPSALNGVEQVLVPIDLASLDMADALWTIWCARVVEVCMGMTEAQIAMLGPDLRLQLLQGRAQDTVTLAAARKQVREQSMRLNAVFEHIDLLLTPATLDVAPPAGEFVMPDHPQAQAWKASGNWLAATPFSHPFNVTQQPALVVPWNKDPVGLPYGIQLVGKRYADELVLEVGAALSRWLNN